MASANQSGLLSTRAQIANAVESVCLHTPLPVDVHTHLYSARFGDLLLWGFDELVTYHYLIAEACRTNRSLTPEQFYALSKPEQADYIWQSLFVEESPISEARRGVLTVLQAYGLDVAKGSPADFRQFFAATTVDEHIARVFSLARVERVVMTNDPFNDTERAIWEQLGPEPDARFLSALRIDPILVRWDRAAERLRAWGYDCWPDLSGDSLAEVRRFLFRWCDLMDPCYLAASLAADFYYPSEYPSTPLLDQAVVPVCEERGIPFAPMIGVKRGVNPALRDAGDGVGKCDVGSVERICAQHPNCDFLVTLLSRENQHELCVAARKFPNLKPFGCWWFLNNPSIIEEITRERIELLGLSFVAQHSDCRVLDQLIYKWEHSRRVLAKVLTEKYTDLWLAGWKLSEQQIAADVRGLLGGNFLKWIGRA